MEPIKMFFQINLSMIYMIKMEKNQMEHLENLNLIFLELKFMIKMEIN